MIKIKKIFEDRKWRKKYNSMKLVFEELLEERQKLIEENDFLRKEVRKFTRERRIMRGGTSK